MARSWLSELKIPAEPGFIPVAKRVATSLGSTLGFNLDELDELSIAVSQSCDSAIAASREAWGDGATLKLNYGATERGIEVEIQALPPRVPATQAHVQRRAATMLQMREYELQRMAMEMIRLFVDDFNSQVDAGAGRVRFRMRKYLVS